MAHPLITIGITCFNAEATILRCLESACNQNYSSFEVLIVDDASTDSSLQLIESFSLKKNNVRIVRHEQNRGCAISRNTIIENACGEFIVFFDDDDTSSPGRLSCQLKTIFEHEQKLNTQKILCYSSSAKIYGNGYRLEKRAIGTEGECPAGQSIFEYIFLGRGRGYFWGDGTPTSTLMCRKSNLQSLNMFDSHLRRVEDIDLALRAGLQGFYFIGTKEFLVDRYHSDGPDKAQEINYSSEIYLIKKYKKILVEMGIYTESFLWFRIRAAYFGKRHHALLGFALLYVIACPKSAFKKAFSTVPQRIRHERCMRTK